MKNRFFKNNLEGKKGISKHNTKPKKKMTGKFNYAQSGTKQMVKTQNTSDKLQ